MTSAKMVLLLCVAIVAPGSVVAGTLRAVPVVTPPVLDGVIDPVWQQAPLLKIQVAPVAHELGQKYDKFDPFWETSGREVQLRAVVSGGRLFLLANWPDTTHSALKKPWVWDGRSDEYVQGAGDEDRFSLLLPMGSEATDCMVEGVSFVGDLWHWKAARTQPAGYADDQTLRMGIKNFRGAEEWHGPGGRTVYGKRFDDAGVSAYTEMKEPPAEFAGETVPRYQPRSPEGSRGDIQAGAVWSDGAWTLELSRNLDTGDKGGDRALAPGVSVEASVAVFDDCGGLYHATSPLFTLVVE